MAMVQVSPMCLREFRLPPVNTSWACVLCKTRIATMKSSFHGGVERSTSMCLRPECWLMRPSLGS